MTSQATLQIQFNNLPVPVNETFKVAGADTHLVLPKGKFFRATADDAQIGFAGIELRIRLSFERAQSTNTGGPVTKIGFANAKVTIATPGQDPTTIRG